MLRANMAGFFDIPEDIFDGSTLFQYIVEINSLRIDFSNDVSIVTQAAVSQNIGENRGVNYIPGDTSSDLLLHKILGSQVNRGVILSEEIFSINFTDGNSLVLSLSPTRLYDAVTIFVEGTLRYIVS
jgi:hypothetical protein